MGDTLAPAGSSTYSSNTMYVGDGTWDSSKNTFLLPNLVGLNFATMQYNGMGNRFSSFEQYHTLIVGHGVLAVITFLFLVPIAIISARFYGHKPGRALRVHIYLQVMTLLLSTVVFILGFFAVGPSRSLSNPHHGIGVAIYTLIIIQAAGGSWVRGKLRSRIIRRPPIKLMLHQWLGRAIAILGIVQVALGLTLYGSPKWTFVLYTLWMTFLLILYFILSYRAAGDIDITHRYSSGAGGTVLQEKKSGGIMQYLLPLAAGAGAAALLSRRKSNRSERDEVVGSRRNSGSYVSEEKEERGGGMMNKLLGAAAVLGAGALAKNFFDKRKAGRNVDEEYSAVDPDTPSRRDRRPRYDDESEISEVTEVRRTERIDNGGRSRPLLPGPGDRVAAAAAISAAEPRPLRPTTPVHAGRLGGRSRRDSYDSYSSVASPSKLRREDSNHNVRNGVLAGLGLAWIGNKIKNRRDEKEAKRLEDIRRQEVEDERRLESERRHGVTPSRFTGDGIPPPPRGNTRGHSRRGPGSDSTFTSELTSVVEPRRGGIMPPLAAGAVPLAAGLAAGMNNRSRPIIGETVPPPPRNTAPLAPPQYSQQDLRDSGSEAYESAGGRNQRRNSRRGREEAAAAAAAGAAATLAAEEERRRERERSRSHAGTAVGDVQSPPVSIKLTQHNDRNKNVTLRRLTEEEAAAERDSRRNRRRRNDSISSMSASETAQSRRRYRRDDSARSTDRRSESARRGAAEAAAEAHVDAQPLSPPRPAFAGGRKVVQGDSGYYGGTPPRPTAPESVGSPDSHGTWSGMSPSGTNLAGDSENPADRRRRRRLERNQRQTNTVEFQ